MAFVDSLLPVEQLTCPVCQDIFTDPVTIPCGHNFCLVCLKGLCDATVQLKCPTCAKTFPSEPELCINEAFKKIVERFKITRHQNGHLCLAKPDEIPCDVCTEKKLRALKSCLVCLTSYCQDHLEPHLRVANLKKHKLIDPVDQLEERLCMKHDRLLEFFCTWDQMCVCKFCCETDHLDHELVSFKDVSEEKKSQLKQTRAYVQQMIQDRQKKMQEVEKAGELSKTNSQRELQESEKIFKDLLDDIEKCQTKLAREAEEKQIAAGRKSAMLLEDMEQEISVLKSRDTELEQLANTQDHLLFLQSFPSLCSIPQTNDWSEVNIYTDQSVGSVRRAMCNLEGSLKKKMEELLKSELQRIQQYAVDVTLDPDTAHPNIILSEDGKQAGRGETKQRCADIPERFDPVLCVLGKTGFSNQRLYYEVQVGDKTYWDLGVVLGSVNRKGKITSTPDNGYWTVRLRNGDEYRALNSPSVLLSLSSKPKKIGLFVDCEEGLVSFYDVEAHSHIYSFTGCRFRERIYPFFSPSVGDDGRNMAPLIITPVNQSP